jgi:hypothetical protein
VQLPKAQWSANHAQVLYAAQEAARTNATQT